MIGAGLAGLGGCTPGDGASRGFGSRQLLAARDPALNLLYFSADGSGIYLARDVGGVPAATVSAMTDTGMVISQVLLPAHDLSRLDLTSGFETAISAGVIWDEPLPGGPGQSRALVMSDFPNGTDVDTILSAAYAPLLSFLDEASGARIDISGVADPFPFLMLGATRADPIAVFRAGDDGQPASSWIGRPEDLAPAPADFPRITARDGLGFIGFKASADGTTASILRLPFDGSAATTLVPATLGAHAVAGDGVDLPAVDVAVLPVEADYQVVCPLSAAGPSAVTPLAPCPLVYDRQFPDGTRRLFARLEDSGETELRAAGGADAFAAGTPFSDGSQLIWIANNADQGVRIFNWMLGSDTVNHCDVPGTALGPSALGTVFRHPDQTGSTALVEVHTSAMEPSPWTLMDIPPGQGCRVVTSGSTQIGALLSSPDGTLLVRLENDATGASTIHLSDLDGGNDRVVATSSGIFDVAFLNDARLLLWRSHAEGPSLSWLDLATLPAAEHPIADRVQLETRSSWVWLNARWLLLGASASAADDTFSVSVVDIETGATQVISSGVIDFRAPWRAPPTDATDLPVVYLARGRSASGEDGVWVAHLSLADFLP